MEITAEQYERIKDSFPLQRGNVRLTHLQVLNAILYVAEQGCKWRGLPERFGNWHTIYVRMNRWARSETAGAIRYALSHWRALTLYLDDGLLEIDNNAAERALHAVAIGRKNYLFMGADSGGQRAASLYSLIGTAKLNGVDRAFYLRTVLATINDDPINRIEELLPWKIAASLQTQPSQAA